MTHDEIFNELRGTMAGLFSLEPALISNESRIVEDLDLDSIDAIDLIIKMQELSGERIDQEAVKTVRTVGDIVDIVERHLSSRR